MNTKLIADAGSTKVEWALLSADNEVAASFMTDGVNALLADPATIAQAFRIAADMLPEGLPVDEVFYYGAGCATSEICDKVKKAISEIWQSAEVYVASDLLGAARSLFADKKGIACILGTGSNSCLYNGKEIEEQIPSLGYVLGDEGSGAALGKRLVSDAFKMQLPENIRDKFLEEYSLTLPMILDKVYRHPAPNKFLASFVPFLHENLWNPYIYSLVLKELTRFVRRNVAMYPGAHSIELSFTGSIAYNFERILREAASSQGYSVTSISETPMQGLIRYHSSKP